MKKIAIFILVSILVSCASTKYIDVVIEDASWSTLEVLENVSDKTLAVYYFTSDEVELHNNDIWLIDAKHTKTDDLPSLGDIKDGLLKMMLFTNLVDIKINGKNLNPVPILKLTTGKGFSIDTLTDKQKELLETLKKEAKTNGFRILANKDFIV